MLILITKPAHKGLYITRVYGFLGLPLAATHKLLVFIAEGGLIACGTEEGGFDSGGEANGGAVRGAFR
jgi:hypothetical protein